jgi:DNA-binding response OmpR family regulator
MTQPKVLLVEDDELLREGLSEYLSLAGLSVIAVGTGLDFFTSLPRLPDLQVAVVDLGLPDIDGRRLVEHLREYTSVRIIVLTASNSPDNRVESYRSGADIYMGKPVDSRELAAAISSLAGRTPAVPHAPVDANLHIDIAHGNGWRWHRSEWKLGCPNGKALVLTAREFQLIDRLVAEQGQLVSRRDICLRLYRRHDAASESALSTLVRRIRRRIADVDANEDPIRTAHGWGYCFSPPIEIY